MILSMQPLLSVNPLCTIEVYRKLCNKVIGITSTHTLYFHALQDFAAHVEIIQVI